MNLSRNSLKYSWMITIPFVLDSRSFYCRTILVIYVFMRFNSRLTYIFCLDIIMKQIIRFDKTLLVNIKSIWPLVFRKIMHPTKYKLGVSLYVHETRYALFWFKLRDKVGMSNKNTNCPLLNVAVAAETKKKCPIFY